MIFRQLFDQVSGTYTYLLASRRGGEALIIDPVIEKVEMYEEAKGRPLYVVSESANLHVEEPFVVKGMVLPTIRPTCL